MNTTTKTIVCGLAAFALYACSSDNTASPENSVLDKSEKKTAQQIIPNSTSVSAEVESNLTSILNGRPITNHIAIDFFCHNDEEDAYGFMFDCGPASTIQLETGTVYHLWDGIQDIISCQTELDTTSYSVQLYHNTITKRWHDPLFTIDNERKEAFRDSCIAEGGNFTEESEDRIACELTLEPLNTDEEYTPPPEGELDWDFFFNYYDPNWEVFASKVIEPCRIRPVINPKLED